jgi:hypothetical protein
MKRIVALFLFLCLSIQSVRAQAFLPFEGPCPLAVMVETNPWLMVTGSDTPSFVLYEDGQVIFRKRSEKKSLVYLWKLLSPAELHSLKGKLTSFGPFRKAHTNIELTLATDQPETKIFLNFKGAELSTSIYGINFANVSGQEERNKTPLPAKLRNLHAFLSSLEFTDAEEWKPKFIEIIAWNYDHAVGASISWPKHLPGLNSPTTIKTGNRYSIFVPGAELKDVLAFLRTRTDKGAVEIDGKKFAVSVRPTFPSEPVWLKALF